MPLGETIAAAATPAGESALAIVRASGPLVPALAAALMGRAAGDVPPPRHATFGHYQALSGEVLDQIVLTYYAAPASATGEDLLEISCHGNPLIIRSILDDLFVRGCRPAQPGEFTRTAFLNGKLDLSQAEAVAELIRARSEGARRAAQRQLDGELSRRVQEFSSTLLQIQAEVEAYIDFPEEDLPVENPAGPREKIKHLAAEVEKLLATARYGTLLREGASAVIAGPPNAGKSSLLNALLGRPRAIVSPEPGTTRDFLQEPFLAGPYAIQITDTAGLRPEPLDPIELEGVARSLEKIADADFLLLVIDSTQEAPAIPAEVIKTISHKNTLVLENKTDLSDSKSLGCFLPDCKHVRLSLITGEGLDILKAQLVTSIESAYAIPNDDLALISARHVSILSRTHAALSSALQKLSHRAPAELLASDLNQALESLGEIIGLDAPDAAARYDHNAMLDRLFATFCIGK
jgi:tRNA modification GTPase